MKRMPWLLVTALLLIGIAAASCTSDDSSTLQVATDAIWPPFEFVDTDTREIVGFDIAVMTAIAERAGLDIEFVNVG